VQVGTGAARHAATFFSHLSVQVGSPTFDVSVPGDPTAYATTSPNSETAVEYGFFPVPTGGTLTARHDYGITSLAFECLARRYLGITISGSPQLFCHSTPQRWLPVVPSPPFVHTLPSWYFAPGLIFAFA